MRPPSRPSKPRSLAFTKPSMYQAVLKQGRVYRGSPLVLKALFPAPDGQMRLGFIIRKKVGDAVLRNTMRRILRESFRESFPFLPGPMWVLFDVMNTANETTRSAFRGRSIEMLARLTAIQSESVRGEAQ